jgi:mRNA interferase RelE/StbE
MNVEITQRASKDFKKLDRSVKKQVKEALEKLDDFPDLTDVKQLKGSPKRYRLRVGNWRIIFCVDWEKNVLTVLTINHRKKVYR